MALGRRVDLLAAEWVRLRDLRMSGRSQQALELAEQTVADSRDRLQVTQALIAQLAVHHAARNQKALPALLTRIEEQLRAAPHPRLEGEYRIFAAGVAYDLGSYGLALYHAVEAERALQRMDEQTQAAVDAWNDLAAMYSVLGYHARAIDAADRCQSLCADAGLPLGLGVALYARVHAAAHRDQHGDSAGCVTALTEVIERSRPILGDLSAINQVMLAYAVRRLAALEHRVALDISAVRDVNPNLDRVNSLGDICDALAAGLPDKALALLDGATGSLDVFGKAEPLRLRSLALARLGDHAGALATERAMQLASNDEERELRRLLAESAGMRIDQDQLRRSAERHARAALTDPLTGLPNRRKLDEFTAELVQAGRAAVVGMLDLDGFKKVNDTHGHPTGDMVLKRVAGVLTRGLRPTDLLARHGGDEFMLVLPDTSRSDAEKLGERVEAAIGEENWESIVPGTPVAISIGWAELDSDVEAALQAADTALYEIKRIRRASR